MERIANRKVRKVVDMAIYAPCNMVERCCNRLKNSRRLATRDDSFLGFVNVAFDLSPAVPRS